MNPGTLFVTGIARGGTTLVARMYEALTGVAMAVDPAFPVFKALRDAVAAAEGMHIDPELPLGDYYGGGTHVLDAVLTANPNVLALPNGSALATALGLRARHECPDIAGALTRLQGSTLGELLRKIRGVIAVARGGGRLVGIKDVWIAEFFPALSRVFPKADFVLILRDPRAALHSMLGLADQSPSQVAHPLSFLRGWRKCASLAFHLQGLLGSHLLTLRYEDLVQAPAAFTEKLCAHVGLPFEEAMLGNEGLTDTARGRAWPGNSSFLKDIRGVCTHSRDRWRQELDSDARDMAQYLCAPEMALWGYDVPRAYDSEAPGGVARLVRTQSIGTYTWRTDSGDSARDLAFEAARRNWWTSAEPDLSLARHYFLFDDVARECRRYLRESS